MVQKKLFFDPWLVGQSQFFTLVKIDFLAYLVNILITSPWASLLCYDSFINSTNSTIIIINRKYEQMD